MKDLFGAFQEKYRDTTYLGFMTWILSGEFSGLENAIGEYPGLPDVLAHTASHWLYINHGQMSENAVLNWLWAMDSGRVRWKTWNDTGVISGYGSKGAIKLATEVVNLMKNAPAEWKRWKSWEENTYWNGEWNPVNLPPHGYAWGNASLFPGLTTDKIEAITGTPIFKWGSGDSTFYIFSLWQGNRICKYNPYISGC
jgi:hypothetical protein